MGGWEKGEAEGIEGVGQWGGCGVQDSSIQLEDRSPSSCVLNAFKTLVEGGKSKNCFHMCQWLKDIGQEGQSPSYDIYEAALLEHDCLHNRCTTDALIIGHKTNYLAVRCFVLPLSILTTSSSSCGFLADRRL